MRGAKAWVPATLVLLLWVAALLFWYAYARGAQAGQTPRPGPTLSAAQTAVIQAVKDYYKVTDEVRRTGDVGLVDSVTFSEGSPANVNFREFMREQEAKSHHSVVVAEYFKDWTVVVNGDDAIAQYTNWSIGHDTDARTGAAIETDQALSKSRYRAALRASQARWLLVTKERTAANVP